MDPLQETHTSALKLIVQTDTFHSDFVFVSEEKVEYVVVETEQRAQYVRVIAKPTRTPDTELVKEVFLFFYGDTVDVPDTDGWNFV